MNPPDRHVIVDLETTGLSPRHGHRVIEIGAVAVENGAIAGSILVAHNAAFDIRFLRHEFARLKMNLPHRHLCTLQLSRNRLPRLPDHTLETIYLYLFPDAGLLRQNHRALDDAWMTRG